MSHGVSFLAALAWAVASIAGLVLGTLVAMYVSLSHTAVARTMAAAAGLLMCAAIVELATPAITTAPSVAIGFASLLAGAAFFSGANAILANRGAGDRKRCGECVVQPTEALSPGSGIAIVLGTAMDAIPEAIVLGVSLRTEESNVTLVLAIALGNIPEALSGTAGMLAAGRSRAWITKLWGTVAAGGVVITLLGYLLAETMTPSVLAILKLIGSGALIALVTETLVPEAVHGSPRYSGVIVTVAFALLFVIAVLAH